MKRIDPKAFGQFDVADELRELIARRRRQRRQLAGLLFAFSGLAILAAVLIIF